jgi:phytoene synthase
VNGVNGMNGMSGMSGANVAAAYDRCEEITRTEAKNFAYGIRLLKGPQRRALSAVYALARRIDDIGDGSAPPDTKLAQLADIRAALSAALSSGPPSDDPVLVAVADAASVYPIPMAAFGELIDGCERDASGAVYSTFEDLAEYCRLVAGSIGRLSLGVFGTPDPARTDPLADQLGMALQLTNILRDIKEDREQLGRIYLPAEDIARFGCHPDLTGPPEAMAELVRFEGRRAEGYFAAGTRLLPLLDRRSRACVGTMAGIYRRLLRTILAEPTAVLTRRVSVPTAVKIQVALRGLAGVS